jgi:hypothetical protein
VSDQLPLPEHVEDPAAVDQLDRSSSHHQHLVLRPLALLEDGGARLEDLHLHPLDKPLHGLLVESAERVVGSQELRDVVHAAYLTVGTVIQNVKAIDCSCKPRHRGCSSSREAASKTDASRLPFRT